MFASAVPSCVAAGTLLSHSMCPFGRSMESDASFIGSIIRSIRLVIWPIEPLACSIWSVVRFIGLVDCHLESNGFCFCFPWIRWLVYLFGCTFDWLSSMSMGSATWSVRPDGWKLLLGSLDLLLSS